MNQPSLSKNWSISLRKISSILLLAGVILAAVFQTARAQQPIPSDNEVNAIAKEMYCPVCENVPLDVCPTQACAQWRELIRQKLSEGWSEKQIKDYFVAQYGDRVLAQPPASGLNWLVYILPPAAFIAGAYILYRVLTSLRKARAAAESAASQAADVKDSDPYLARLEEELQRFERGGS
jgi:cytochrome c-type biogenesis protein CcmH